MAIKKQKTCKKKKVDDSIKLITAGEVVSYRKSWRIFKIMSEFVDGYQFLGNLKREVTIFGSARFKPNNKYYKIAAEFGRLLGKNGFTTITGGGPGIMEAANRGAFEVGGESIGLNIQLPFEQRINPYVKKSTAFHYFFTRKVMLTSPANAFIFFPGGFGTLDEFFEVVHLMEQGFMEKLPIVLVGSAFWNPILKFLKEKSCKEVNSVSSEVIDKWNIVDTAEEAFEYIKNTKDKPNRYSPECCSNVDNAEWHIFRIMSELVEGFEFLTKLKNGVTVLGTKSIMPDTPYYNAAREIGTFLAKNSVTSINGGGPGIMEAVSRGTYEAGGESVGINMRVDNVERRNKYLTQTMGFTFPFVRKLIITAPSKGFVFFPGGLGTMHQLFELLTLLETGKIKKLPVCLYDNAFWSPLVDFIDVMCDDFKTISKSDRKLFKVVNSVKDVNSCIL